MRNGNRTRAQLIEELTNLRQQMVDLEAQTLESRHRAADTERQRVEGTKRHLGRMEALREIDKAIISTLDLGEVLDIILAKLEKVVPYHSTAIFLLAHGAATVAAARGFPDMERVLQISFPVEEDALIAALLQEKRPLVLADARADGRFLARGGTAYVRSWLGLPLIVKGDVIGFLTVDHTEPGIYDEKSAEQVQAFASQAAIAIEAAGLRYIWLGESLGGRPKDPTLYDTGSERPDYDRMREIGEFQAGIDELLELAGQDTVAMMCSEGDYTQCHRTLLITPTLLDREARVRHILPDGRTVEAVKEPEQLSLFRPFYSVA